MFDKMQVVTNTGKHIYINEFGKADASVLTGVPTRNKICFYFSLFFIKFEFGECDC